GIIPEAGGVARFPACRVQPGTWVTLLSGHMGVTHVPGLDREWTVSPRTHGFASAPTWSVRSPRRYGTIVNWTALLNAAPAGAAADWIRAWNDTVRPIHVGSLVSETGSRFGG